MVSLTALRACGVPIGGTGDLGGTWSGLDCLVSVSEPAFVCSWDVFMGSPLISLPTRCSFYQKFLFGGIILAVGHFISVWEQLLEFLSF